MNLLVVGTDFPPSIGGISTYTAELARALNNMCQVTILTRGVFNSESFDKAYQVRIVRTPQIPILRTLALFIYLPWLLRSYKIDAVLHTVWPTALISHIWYCLIPVPYFISVHASEILDDTLTWRRRFKSYLKRWRRVALIRAKGIFPVSRYSASLLTDLGMEKSRIHVITNGVDSQRFKPAAAHQIGDKQKRLLTVARLDLHKGHDRVLEALAILKKQGLKPNYVIVGQGEEEKRLRTMVQSFGLERQVIFAGFIPGSQLPAMYAACDIFIMTSREIPGRLDLIEGFGISFLEASASGLPVIAGCSGGVPDAVRDGETGLLVNPDDPRVIAYAIQRLLIDTDLAKRLGNEGRHWIETQMTWEHVAHRLHEAMKRLILNK
ncbi:MAG: phosphatidyl-myo-inositol dimannoside synthase [Desulfobacteraceae bacterium Eth-SRB1]|nr:MAG: phosphatidyl-myo-inositol dimannoside synthase [Desulfobacteraceae bacterium Eth-SRB1]